MPTPRRVALLIEATNAYARGLLHGVAKFNRENSHWTLDFEPYGPQGPLPKWLSGWKGDGILVRITNRRVANAVRALKVPVVDLRRLIAVRGVPSIGPDNKVVARLAFDHLRERGFTNFAFCGVANRADPPLEERAAAFVELVERSGYGCYSFKPRSEATIDEEHKQLVAWVKSLPKPTGIVACIDHRGHQVLRACAHAGIRVPDRVAVLGVGNDDCLCDLSEPSLSSIVLPAELVGYDAAVLLDRMMSGGGTPSKAIQVPAQGIVTRMSTDVLASEDEAVVRALAYVRERACQNVGVSDVLRHVNLSRSALEPRFKAVLGRTVHGEIRRLQVEKAKTLLSTTKALGKEVAAQAGFLNVQYLAKVFRKETGYTVSQFRRLNHWNTR